MSVVTLTKLKEDDLEQFVVDNQEAFKYGALEEFGKRDDHFEEDEEIISRKRSSIVFKMAKRIESKRME
ncbi:MAG: hypothetical protein J6T34_05075 [Bacilli bacterium]|nr:hypothetical protein [Bacilli bacterium]